MPNPAATGWPSTPTSDLLFRSLAARAGIPAGGPAPMPEYIDRQGISGMPERYNPAADIPNWMDILGSGLVRRASGIGQGVVGALRNIPGASGLGDTADDYTQLAQAASASGMSVPEFMLRNQMVNQKWDAIRARDAASQQAETQRSLQDIQRRGATERRAISGGYMADVGPRVDALPKNPWQPNVAVAPPPGGGTWQQRAQANAAPAPTDASGAAANLAEKGYVYVPGGGWIRSDNPRLAGVTPKAPTGYLAGGRIQGGSGLSDYGGTGSNRAIPTPAPALPPVVTQDAAAAIPRVEGRKLYNAAENDYARQNYLRSQAVRQGWASRGGYDPDTGAPAINPATGVPFPVQRVNPMNNEWVRRQVNRGQFQGVPMRPDVERQLGQQEGAQEPESPWAGAARNLGEGIGSIASAVGGWIPSLFGGKKKSATSAPLPAMAYGGQTVAGQLGPATMAQIPHRGPLAGVPLPMNTVGELGQPETVTVTPPIGAGMPGIPATYGPTQPDPEEGLAQAPAPAANIPGNNYYMKAAVGESQRRANFAKEKAQRAQQAQQEAALARMSPHERLGWAQWQTNQKREQDRDRTANRRLDQEFNYRQAQDTTANRRWDIQEQHYKDQTKQAAENTARLQKHDAWAAFTQQALIVAGEMAKEPDQTRRAAMAKRLDELNAQADSLRRELYPTLSGNAPTPSGSTPQGITPRALAIAANATTPEEMLSAYGGKAPTDPAQYAEFSKNFVQKFPKSAVPIAGSALAAAGIPSPSAPSSAATQPFYSQTAPPDDVKTVIETIAAGSPDIDSAVQRLAAYKAYPETIQKALKDKFGSGFDAWLRGDSRNWEDRFQWLLNPGGTGQYLREQRANERAALLGIPALQLSEKAQRGKAIRDKATSGGWAGAASNSEED